MSDLRKLTLSEILKKHSDFQSKGLSNALGDGFLIAKNRICSKLRKETKKAGFRFDWNNDLYFDFPLMALNDIFKNKSIPFRRNARRLLMIDRERPGFYSLGDLSGVFPQKNVFIHEQAHCIAFAKVFKNWGVFKRQAKKPDFLLKLLLGEAFANTCEVIIQHDAKSSIESVFAKLNVHFILTADNHAQFKNLVERYGRSAAIRICFAGFLYSNCLYVELGKKDIDHILAIAGIDEKQVVRKQVEEFLTTVPLMLDHNFKILTTRIYLTSLGYNQDVIKHFNFDPGLIIRKNPEILGYINYFCDLLE